MSSTRTLEVRAHPLLFGTVIFLASELMFFAGLFAAYYSLRVNAAVWPPADVRLDVGGASIGTALLALSSACAFGMTFFLRRSAFERARLCLGAAIALAVAFLAITLHGWSKLAFHIDSHAYGSVFYAMTGFHALHVVAGIILLCWVFFGMRMPALARDELAGVEAISYYWHFVFAVWVGIWGSIYLIR